MEPDSGSSYFSLPQLWLSLAFAVLIGSTLWLVLAFANPNRSAATPTPIATTTVAAAPAENPYRDIQLSAQAAVVVDLTTGQTLYSENADARLPLASLTKLVSAYAALRTLPAQSLITVSSSSIAQDGESGLTIGEQFTAADLARLALVASSNDAADALTRAAADARGTAETNLLASAVAAAGLGRTEAINGTGLDVDLENAGGYGTARDVATLAARIVREFPELARATTEPAVEVASSVGEWHRLDNTNPFAAATPGLLLSKTGFTDLAGGNLAVVYDAGLGNPVAIVVLGSTREARFSDVAALRSATQRALDLTPRAL